MSVTVGGVLFHWLLAAHCCWWSVFVFFFNFLTGLYYWRSVFMLATFSWMVRGHGDIMFIFAPCVFSAV